MNRRDLIKAAAATGILSQIAWAQQGPPDILFISVDDLNDWVNPFDAPKPVSEAITPFIQSLAQSSTVFQRAYAPSIICGASRSAVLSGMAPHVTGVLNNENLFEPRVLPGAQGFEGPLLQNHQGSIAKWLKIAGYRTALCGKVYHGAGYNDLAWATPGMRETGVWDAYRNVDNDELFLSGKACPTSQSSADISQWAQAYCGDPDHLPDVKVKNWAVQQLACSVPTQPLFLALGLFKPHTRWQVPLAHLNAFNLNNIEVPNRVTELDKAAGDPAISCLGLNRSGDEPNSGDWEGSLKIATQAYLGCIRFVDAMIGEILVAAKARRDATSRRQIIVLWSDHGYFLGTRQGFHKTKFFERAARVPLLIFDSGRNLTAPQTVMTPVSTQDLFPTLLELGQVGNGNNQLNPLLVDGQSLVPYINGGSAPEQDVLSSFNFRQLWGAGLAAGAVACSAERALATTSVVHPSRAIGASYSLRWRDQANGAIWRYTWYYQAGLFTRLSGQAPIPNEELTQVNPSTLDDGANLLAGSNAASFEPVRVFLKARLETRIGRALA